MNIGQVILEELIDANLLSAQNCSGEPVIFVWSANSEEQIEAIMFRHAVEIYNEMLLHSLKNEQ